MKLDEATRNDGWMGAAVGTITALAVGGLLGAGREHVGPTTGALVLAIVVVVAASLGGRRAGLTTAVVATTAFNFFLVPPYLTLRVDAGQDLAAVVTLGMMGLVVGLGAERRGRSEASVADGIGAIAALSRIADMVAEPCEEDLIWRELGRSLEIVLGVTDVRLVSDAADPRLLTTPTLDERGAVVRSNHPAERTVRRLLYTSRGLTLPAEGIAVPLHPGHRERGALLMTTSPRVGSTQEHRIAAVAMVRLWALRHSAAERVAG